MLKNSETQSERGFAVLIHSLLIFEGLKCCWQKILSLSTSRQGGNQNRTQQILFNYGQ